jgi:hypothetical protein
MRNYISALSALTLGVTGCASEPEGGTTAAAPGSGVRMALDRDRNGLLDGG